MIWDGSVPPLLKHWRKSATEQPKKEQKATECWRCLVSLDFGSSMWWVLEAEVRSEQRELTWMQFWATNLQRPPTWMQFWEGSRPSVFTSSLGDANVWKPWIKWHLTSFNVDLNPLSWFHFIIERYLCDAFIGIEVWGKNRKEVFMENSEGHTLKGRVLIMRDFNLPWIDWGQE